MTYSKEKIAEMTLEAQTIFAHDGLAGIIKGGEASLQEVIPQLIEAFPQAQKKRPENPNYAFADFVNEFSVMITGGIIKKGLNQTRGALANRHG